MGDSSSSLGPSSSPPQLSPKSTLPMLYYGLVVVGTAAILLALYNLIIIRWCAQREEESRRSRPARLAELTASQSFENSGRNLLSSFKYKKAAESKNMGTNGEYEYEYECAVCLSVFEDGEEVRQLPRCKHRFHAPCIDMWLHSHFDCPLCRTSVHPSSPSPFCHRQTTSLAENSREGLLDAAITTV